MAVSIVVKEIVGGPEKLQAQLDTIVGALDPVPTAGTVPSVAVAGLGPRYTIFISYVHA